MCILCEGRNDTPDMRPYHPTLPERILTLLAGVLILKVTTSVVSNYHNYFPPNFASDFLRGRERHFLGVYQWAFYAHILSGPVSLILGLILIGERSRSPFSEMPSISRPASSRVCLVAGDAQRTLDGLSCRGRSHRGGRIGGTGHRDRDLRLTRRMVGGDATICGSSSLDVAMLSLVMLGRRAQADWRVGDGHGSGRPVGRSPGDLDELARAAHGFRVTRADEAKSGRSSSIGHEFEGHMSGGIRRFVEIKTVTSLAVTMAVDRHEARAYYHSLATSLSLPEIDINARRTAAGVLAFRNRTLTIDEARVRASRVMEFCGRPEAHHQRLVRIHRSHPGDGILLAGFDHHECRLVSVRDLRQASRLLGNQAAIRSNDRQVGRRVLWPDRLRATKNGNERFRAPWRSPGRSRVSRGQSSGKAVLARDRAGSACASCAMVCRSRPRCTRAARPCAPVHSCAEPARSASGCWCTGPRRAAGPALRMAGNRSAIRIAMMPRTTRSFDEPESSPRARLRDGVVELRIVLELGGHGRDS